MKKYTLVLASMGILTAGLEARANNVIFSDNFNGENGSVAFLNIGTPLQDGNGNVGLLSPTLSNWTLTGGAVDLIGKVAANQNTGGGPNYDFIPGHGLYIDLDGTSRNLGSTPAGQITSKTFSLGIGTYELTFLLAGSQRGDVNTTVVEVKTGVTSQSFTVGANDGFIKRTMDFTLAAPQDINLVFTDTDATDTFGLLLDDVELDGITGDPVPDGGSTALLLGVGVLGLGLLRRKLA